MKSSLRLIFALALFVAPLFTHAELVGSPSSPTPQATINNVNLNNSFAPSGPSDFLPSTIIPDTSPAPSLKQTLDKSAASAPSSSFVPLAPIPGLTEGVVANSQGLANFLNNLYKYLIGVAAVLAVVMIIWGGLEIATQDSVSKQGAGRKKIQDALYGLVLVLSPALVFGIINPSILDLNFAKSLKPLDIHNTKSAQQTNLNQAPGNNPGQGAPPANGCNTPTGGAEFQTISCATDQAAIDWNKQHCSGSGEIIKGACAQGFNSQGQCNGGAYPQVVCPGTSTRGYTFVAENTGTGSTGGGVLYLRPITVDKPAVDAFVNGCSTNILSFPDDGVGFIGICTPDSYSFSTKYQNPKCYGSKLICTNSSYVGAEKSKSEYILKDN